MIVLVVGASGFVGKSLITYILNEKKDVELIGTYHENFPNDFKDKMHLEKYELNDEKKIRSIIEKYKPDYIFQLAGPAYIPDSLNKPKRTIEEIFNSTLYLMESVKNFSPHSKVLYIGSASEYGKCGENEFKIKEDSFVNPENPYSFSKYIAEQLCLQYYKSYGIDVIMVRPFNHIGHGQSERFVCSSFAKQIVQIEKGIQHPVIKVGNLDVIRDFLDVRDVVKAYWMIMESGIFGQIYNVCSGKGISIRTLLEMLIEKSTYEGTIEIVVQESLLRKEDSQSIIGDNKKLIDSIGWEPLYSIEETLESTLKYWRNKNDGFSE